MKYIKIFKLILVDLFHSLSLLLQKILNPYELNITTNMLPEDRRKQLDDIVKLMSEKNESDDTIQFVVDDFKTKYKQENPEEIGAFGTFSKGVASAFKERVGSAGQEQFRSEEGGISPLRATLRTIGQGAGFVGDVGFEVLKLLAPKSVEDVAKKGAQKIGETEIAQDLMGKYSQLKEKYPEAIKDVEAVLNIGALLPVGKATQFGVRGAKQTIQKVDNVITNMVTKSERQIESSILKRFEKGVKPNLQGKATPTQLSNYRDDVISAVKTINQNKINLSYTDDLGDIIKGQNPKTLQQLSDSIDQTKKTIYKQYDNLAKSANKAGLQIELKALANELDTVIDSKSLSLTNPQAIEYASDLKNRLVTRSKLDATTAQEVIQNYNNALQAFYKNPTYDNASRAAIDSLVANKLRESLDSGITGLTGKEYQALKNQYGALKSIERDVLRATVRDARKNAKGLIDFTDIFSGGQVVSGIVSLNPALIASGAAQKSIAQFYKFLNNPNRAIEKLFKDVEKLR